MCKRPTIRIQPTLIGNPMDNPDHADHTRTFLVAFRNFIGHSIQANRMALMEVEARIQVATHDLQDTWQDLHAHDLLQAQQDLRNLNTMATVMAAQLVPAQLLHYNLGLVVNEMELSQEEESETILVRF